MRMPMVSVDSVQALLGTFGGAQSNGASATQLKQPSTCARKKLRRRVPSGTALKVLPEALMQRPQAVLAQGHSEEARHEGTTVAPFT